MSQLEVYCTVSNCHYWTGGDHCTAGTILVTTDEIATRYPEDAGLQDIVREHGTTQARSSRQTCCKTFTPSGAAGSADDTDLDRDEQAPELAGRP